MNNHHSNYKHNHTDAIKVNGFTVNIENYLKNKSLPSDSGNI